MRERGLKPPTPQEQKIINASLPVRERGLKHQRTPQSIVRRVAPRAGAWIEAHYVKLSLDLFYVAPRAGAWIEAQTSSATSNQHRVAPRAGAWIEAEP